jgi:hypothetical protein
MRSAVGQSGQASQSRRVARVLDPYGVPLLRIESACVRMVCFSRGAHRAGLPRRTSVEFADVSVSMNETGSTRAVLSAIAELGSATLESVMIRLEPELAPMDAARGFQTARKRAWIVEAEPALNDSAEPSYRLSPSGIEELRREPGTPLRSIDGGRADPDVPVSKLLEVIAEFEQLEGTSLELAAWELDVDQTRLKTVWSSAIDDGLIETCGIQIVDGREERMWRLSDRGRKRWGRPDERTG